MRAKLLFASTNTEARTTSRLTISASTKMAQTQQIGESTVCIHLVSLSRLEHLLSVAGLVLALCSQTQ